MDFAAHAALAQARGMAGIRRLEARAPDRFVRVTEPVHMNSSKLCVLGQMFGSYRAGLAALGITHAEALLLGFRCDSWELNVNGWHNRQAVTRYYATLDRLFDHEIALRVRS